MNIETIDNKKIRWFGNIEQPWVVGKDIADFLGYTDTDQALRVHVDDEDKKSAKDLEFKKLHPYTILINLLGVKTLITYGKKHNDRLLSWLDDVFNIKTTVIKRLSKEEEYISYIKQSFSVEKMKEQYYIDDYKIDLFFPDYNIAIECDENNHTDRDPLYEKQRQEEIITKTGCVFVRFNPDEKKFNIFKVIGEIHRIIIDKITHTKKLQKLS